MTSNLPMSVTRGAMNQDMCSKDAVFPTDSTPELCDDHVLSSLRAILSSNWRDHHEDHLLSESESSNNHEGTNVAKESNMDTACVSPIAALDLAKLPPLDEIFADLEDGCLPSDYNELLLQDDPLTKPIETEFGDHFTFPRLFQDACSSSLSSRSPTPNSSNASPMPLTTTPCFDEGPKTRSDFVSPSSTIPRVSSQEWNRIEASPSFVHVPNGVLGSEHAIVPISPPPHSSFVSTTSINVNNVDTMMPAPFSSAHNTIPGDFVDTFDSTRSGVWKSNLVPVSSHKTTPATRKKPQPPRKRGPKPPASQPGAQMGAVVHSIGEYDVVFGRGGKSIHHVGNIRFRDMILQLLESYERSTKEEKTEIAKSVVRRITEELEGRFLMKQGCKRWTVVPFQMARKKTSQRFREALGSRGLGRTSSLHHHDDKVDEEYNW